MATVDFSRVHRPHEKQLEMHESNSRNKVMEWARRLGKSRAALFELVDAWMTAMQEPAPASLIPPFHAWIVAPTFPQAEQAWTELQEFFPDHWKSTVLQDMKRMDLKGDVNGNRRWGRIEVRSAHDPTALQTAGLDFLWVTECQDIMEAAFQRLRPMMMSADRMSRAVWEGIPALYADHWWWKLCDMAQRENNPEWFYSHGTAYENPFLTDEQLAEIETDRELMPSMAWRRMYLAERSESAGFFHKIDQCIVGDFLDIPIPQTRYVAGIDLGRKHDPSVMYVADATSRKVVHRYGWDANTEWSAQRDGMIAIAERFEVERVNVDATGMGGDIFVETLQEAGLPVEPYIFTERSRMDLLNNLAISIERGSVTFPHEPTLLRQLRQYQFIKHGRSVRPDHPDGEHDDDVMALGLCLLMCDDSRPQVLGKNVGGRMSYMQSNGAHDGAGSRLMRQRLQQRMEERWQRSGIEV